MQSIDIEDETDPERSRRSLFVSPLTKKHRHLALLYFAVRGFRGDPNRFHRLHSQNAGFLFCMAFFRTMNRRRYGKKDRDSRYYY